MALPYEALRTFLAVAQAGSFSGAARELGVSQPWVSQRVAQLEGYLSRRRAGSFQLVERRRRGIVLTPDGQLLRSLAGDPVGALEHLEDAFEAQRGTISGSVRVAASSTMLLYLVPDAIRRFRSQNPGVRLETRACNSSTMFKLVLDDQVDFALGDPGDSIPPGLRVEIVRSCARLLVARAGDPILCGKGPLPLAELQERDWIVLPQPWSLTRRKLDSLLGHYPIAMEVEHWEVMKQYVGLGVGIALMPDLCILPRDRKQIGARALGPSFGKTHFCLALRKRKLLSAAALALIRAIAPEVAARLGS